MQESVDTGADVAVDDTETEDDEIRALLRPAEEADEIGRLGGYRILDVLGRGGMGVVFRAEDVRLKRPVALKIVRPSLVAKKSARERLLREARATAAIEHDHIAMVYQVDEDQGVPFLAMQLLQGQSLADRIHQQPLLPLTEVLRIGRETAEGLAAAHGRGLLHRDVTPANIWLEAPRGRVKIVDFGLARAVESETLLTQSGAVMGTPEYMAPEQAQGQPVDQRCDLFSLGCVLYRLATGRSAFSGSNVTATLIAVSRDEAVPPQEINPALPAPLADLITTLLAKDPDARYQSAEQVIAAIGAIELQTAREKSPAPSREVAEPPAAKPAARQRAAAVAPPRYRRPFAIAAAAIPLAALLGFLIYLSTDNGFLVVQSEVDDVQITIKQNDRIVKSMEVSTNGITTRLRSGQYEIAFAGNATDRLLIDSDKVTLRRGGRTVVKIERRRTQLDETNRVVPQPARPTDLPRHAAEVRPQTPSADRAEPFEVITDSGEERSSFKSFQRALNALQYGETLRVHGNGPFTVDEQINLRDQGLTLEAAPGYRPRFDCKAGFGIDGGPCVVRGCEFRSLSPGGLTFFAGGAPRFEFHGCHFFGADFRVINTEGVSGTTLYVADCFVWNSGANGVFTLGSQTESELTNNVVHGQQGHLIIFNAVDGQVVRLRNNTFSASRHNIIGFWRFDVPDSKPVRVEATGNIFGAHDGVFNTELTDGLRKRIHWRGNHNLYVGDRAPFSYADDAHVNGLADWYMLWGREEEGSRAAKQVFCRWQELAFSDAAFARRTIEDIVLDARERYRIEVGPDWELVGPGDGYVRDLAARGQQLSDDQLRPPPREGFPFLVLRGDKPSGNTSPCKEHSTRPLTAT